MRQEIFRMERVTYEEHGVIQLEDFNLQIYKGEIMGLIPANGQGLPAFLKLLQTNMPLKDGFVYYKETLINSWVNARKGYNRISIVQSKSSLVEGLTVADNVFVLRPGFRQRIIQPSLFRKQLGPFFAELELNISADTYVEKLSYFERIVVEILKAVITGTGLIVLDQIGSSINEAEFEKLYLIMRKYARQGISFLYISSDFGEVFQYCDRAALFSDGCIQKVIHNSEMTREVMIQYEEEYYKSFHKYMTEQNDSESGQDVVFAFNEITCEAVKRLSFKVRRGECIVLQSFNQVAFQNLTEWLTGEREVDDGEVYLEGKEIRIPDTKEIAIIQEQPTQTMIFREMNYMQNLCFGLFRRLGNVENVSKIEESVRREYASVLGEQVFSMHMDELKEWQKYQLVYTRILLQKPKVVFCIQPFKWTDLPHRLFVSELIEMLLGKGIAVIILVVNLSGAMLPANRLIRISPKGRSVDLSRKEVEMVDRQKEIKSEKTGGLSNDNKKI